MNAIVTLNDGTVVDTNSQQWKDECNKRHRQVMDMRLLTKEQRLDYLAKVNRTEGDQAEQRLRAAFLKWWDTRRETA